MLRRIIQDGLITGILVVGLVPLVHAGDQEKVPVSSGIVLTIAAIDPKTDTATLKTQQGEEAFQTTTYASWKVGDKVECDLVKTVRGQELHDCKPWQ
jgi:hypothetical protein